MIYFEGMGYGRFASIYGCHLLDYLGDCQLLKHDSCVRKRNHNRYNNNNNRDDWDYLKVIQKIREEYTKKTRSQGTTENSHIGHCTHTSESTNVKIQ